jgi:uncharacterized protein (TIGR02611 family)
VIRARESFAHRRWINLVYRVVVGLIGFGIVALGIIMLPAPGPGWVVIFAGLGVLATEFEAARKLLAFARRKYVEWVAWLGRQSALVRILVSSGILLLVAAFAWLFGMFALVGGWFGVDWAWLRSPLFGAS